MSLLRRLQDLDGNSYGAYKSLKGRHFLNDDLTLHIDRVQADPYAPPSNVRVRLDAATTGIPRKLLASVAGRDFLARRLASSSRDGISSDRPGQQVLPATAVLLDADQLELRLDIHLPARGRRILGHAAARLIGDTLVDIVEEAIFDASLDDLRRAVTLYDDQQFIRSELGARNLVAFIADGSILPRRSGDSDLPLSDATPFHSPSTLTTRLILPSGRTVTGMGIPAGVTVIVGGGFHGKSTLLRALQLGVYNHVAGDGREFAIARNDAVTLRAEDGRAVTDVNISPFINNLPSGNNTRHFSTSNASGSTSQAAWLIEALEAGASTLLIDEDTSATNFMIRDEKMRALVPDSREPITPLIQRITGLTRNGETSVVLVTGGTSAFLDVADTVILMDAYLPHDVTEQAKKLSGDACYTSTFPTIDPRRPSIRIAGRKPPQGKDLQHIRIDRDTLDLSALSQLVHPSQTRAIASLLPLVRDKLNGGYMLKVACEKALEHWDDSGSGRLAKPRLAELMFAINHLR